MLGCYEVIDEHVDHTVTLEKLRETMRFYGVEDDKVTRIITDGDSNIKLAVATSNLVGAWCLCHLLDLFVKDTLAQCNISLKTIMQKVKDLA